MNRRELFQSLALAPLISPDGESMDHFLALNAGYPDITTVPYFSKKDLPVWWMVDCSFKLRLRSADLPPFFSLQDLEPLTVFLNAQKHRRFLERFPVEVSHDPHAGFAGAVPKQGQAIFHFDEPFHEGDRERNITWNGQLPLERIRDEHTGEWILRLAFSGARSPAIPGYDFACDVFINDGVKRPDLKGIEMYERGTEEWLTAIKTFGHRQRDTLYQLPLELR